MAEAGESTGGRPAQVCQACRIRHKKCDFEAAACRQCRNIGLACIRQPAFRFRYDARQIELAAEPPRSQGHHTPTALEFYDETPGLLQSYVATSMEDYAAGKTKLSGRSGRSGTPSPLTGVEHCGDSATTSFYMSPPRDDQTSPDHMSGLSYSGHAAAQPFTESEAVLVRNFAENMALWTDVTDPERSFQFELPRRALTEPVLRHAVCAFSARHYHRSDPGGEGQTEAWDHQNRCLELLIPSMSGGQGISESTFTAIALLRQNEEMDEHDNRFHLEGISRILNMVPNFATAGGLGEAAAWLCLREDIYIALTTQSPVKVEIESFRSSTSIRRNDDFAWANKMVLGLAVLLNRTFSKPASQEDLAASEEDIADWARSKPAWFKPILFRARSPTEDRYFPDIWMLAPHHAVGLQYFHIAQIVLHVFRKRVSDMAHDHPDETRNRERQIRHHLTIVIGLAVSNDRAENTWFTARHCLSVWAACLRKRGDQQAALRFLRDMEQRTGWSATALSESIRRQWDDNGDDT